MLKKFLALAFMLVTLIFVGEAKAGIVTDRFPLFCYVDHQVDTYNQPNGQRVGYISPNVDLIRVTQVRGDGWAYGDYPGKNGRVARWFRITDICADPGYSNRGVDVSGSHQVYRTQNDNNTIGSISNENVIVLADNGNRAQILYRLNNGTGYKMGWVPSSVVSGGNVNVNHNPQGTVQTADSPSAGVLHVRGTAFDADNPSGSIRLHVYVGGGAGSGAPGYEIRTDGGNRIFDDTRNVGRTGNQHVYVYALNDYGSGGNVEIWNGYVNIQGNNPTPSGDVRQRLLNAIFGRSGGRISCDFDSYVNTPGRHEGIDMVLQNGAEIHAINSGIVTKAGGDSLNTVAIYDPTNNKTIVYLHMSSVIGLYVNKQVNKGDVIGYQGSKGASSSHIHLEVRDGQRSAAAKSVNDSRLDNSNPYSYLEKIL